MKKVEVVTTGRYPTRYASLDNPQKIVVFEPNEHGYYYNCLDHTRPLIGDEEINQELACYQDANDMFTINRKSDGKLSIVFEDRAGRRETMDTEFTDIKDAVIKAGIEFNFEVVWKINEEPTISVYFATNGQPSQEFLEDFEKRARQALGYKFISKLPVVNVKDGAIPPFVHVFLTIPEKDKNFWNGLIAGMDLLDDWQEYATPKDYYEHK